MLVRRLVCMVAELIMLMARKGLLDVHLHVNLDRERGRCKARERCRERLMEILLT